MIVFLSESGVADADLLALLRETGELLPEPLSRRQMDVDAYFHKLRRQANFCLAIEDHKPVGLLAYYANDLINRTAYLTFMGILPHFQNRKIGAELLTKMISDCERAGFRRITLEVHPGNAVAIHLYQKHGFSPYKIDAGKIVMELPLYSRRESSTLDIGSADLLPGIDLRIKRDDLYPFCGGGNKARKIGRIVESARRQGCDAIVTNGALQSNHARATALACAEAGLNCHLVLHTEGAPPAAVEGNLLLMRLAGADIEYCRNSELGSRMDSAMESCRERGLRPFYVWGGGHCLEGSMAFYDAAAEAQEQCADWVPDFVVHASGTGTTQAGLIAGYVHLPTRVIGVSVARPRERGTEIIRQSLLELGGHVQRDFSPAVIDFRADWLEGGYACSSRQLLQTIAAAGKRGLVLDPTYSGKAFLGLCELHRSGVIPSGSRVLFWHTGGLLNLLSSPEIQGKKA